MTWKSMRQKENINFRKPQTFDITFQMIDFPEIILALQIIAEESEENIKNL